MFGLDIGDNPLILLGELALSVIVIVGIMYAVRLANGGSTVPDRATGVRGTSGTEKESGIPTARDEGQSSEEAEPSNDSKATPH